MNTRELAKMGICGDCIGAAITAIQRASASGRLFAMTGMKPERAAYLASRKLSRN